MRFVPQFVAMICSVGERLLTSIPCEWSSDFISPSYEKKKRQKQQKATTTKLFDNNIQLKYFTPKYITKLNLLTNRGRDNKIKAVELYFHYVSFKVKCAAEPFFLYSY